MSSLRNTAALASLFVFALGSACTASSEDDTGQSEGATTESRDDYDFQLPAPTDKMVRVDAMGIALTSTVLMNRDRTPSGKDNKNKYQIDTPDVQNSPKTLFAFVHFLRTIHKYWRDQLKAAGFEPCSKIILGVVAATPCTLQKIKFAEDPNRDGPRVIGTVLPDYITLDFNEPNRFPNGRTPWEPVSDKVFALGFLKMGGKCPGIDTMPRADGEPPRRAVRDRDGVPICTIESFADAHLQVWENDRPFFTDKFPYLAKPWFYPEATNGAPYYWPTAQRLSRPE